MKQNIIKFLADLASIPIIITGAYTLKFKLGLVINYLFNTTNGIIYHHAQLEPYLENIVLIMVLWAISFYAMGIYKSYSGIMSSVDESIQLIKGVSLTIVLIMAVSKIYTLFPDSFFVLVYAWSLGVFVLIINRIILNKCFGFNQQPGKTTLIYGASSEAQNITERLITHQKNNFNYIGTIATTKPKDIKYTLKDTFKYLGKPATLESVIKKHNIAALIVIIPDYDESKLDDLVTVCEKYCIQLLVHYAISASLSGVSTFVDFSGVPLVSYKQFQLSTKERLLKRCLDITGAFLGSLVALPLFGAIALWIKCVSPQGPVLFKQERVGCNGRVFWMLKFRTMHPQAEKKSGPKWAGNDEDRYIKGGHFLRKFSLDETPQLLNILKNEMSLVGPRPERPFFVTKICKEAPYFNLRHQIKGGLTGWAQIHGRAYLTTRPLEKFQYDLYYIKNMSIILDIKIMIKTVFMVVRGEQAY